MFARNFPRLVLLLVLSPGAALALGLGDIHVKSSLDAPLSADIDVVDASADDLSTLKATLAPRDTFTHFGADFPAFLGTVTLTTERAADGHAVIHITSSSAADEPFATLLVEADWARGHVVREYTVLLDPPTFAPQGQSNPAVAAPAVESTQRAGNIEAGAAAAAAASDTGNAPEATTHPAGPAPEAEAASGATNGGAAHGNDAAPGNANAGGTAGNAGSSASSDSAGASSSGAKAGTYTVRRGDTLSSIAQQNYSGSSRAQRDRALVAIYRANPRAFGGKNMNELRAGSTLNLPGDDELVAIGPSEASSEVRSQYDSWRNTRGAAGSAPGTAQSASAAGASGQLRLVAPQQPAQEAAQGGSEAAQEAPSAAAGPGSGGGGTNGSAAGNAALQQRVQQLQGQLSDTQRLLQLRDAQLASLQARIAQQAAQGANAPAAAPSAPPPASPSAVPSTPGVNPPVPGVAPNVPAPVASTPAAPPAANPALPTTPATSPPPAAAVPGVTPVHPPVKRPVPLHPRSAPPPPPSNSVLDLVREYWYVPAVLLLAGIGLLVMRAWRSRQEDAFDRSLGRLNEPDFEPSAPPSRSDTVPVRTMPSAREEPSYRVEESGTHQRPHFDEDPLEASAATGEHVAVDTSATGEAPVALDQGDPLAEADFHMAYGLYDQAAELVQGAIAREPQRRDLKLKLLEVFFVWGNKDRFLQSAHELAATRNQAPPGEWEKIVIMGRQIAPEDPIFADSRALAGVARGGVDLNLEGGQNRVDFDLLGEPTLNAVEAPIDLDVGSALDHTQAAVAALDMDKTGESQGLGSVDFVVDSDDLAADEATGTTRKMPGSGSAAAITREMPAIPTARAAGDTTRVARTSEMEAPTVEQPQLRRDEHSTIHEKLDAAARQGMLAGEQTAELAIDDLGLELGNLEMHETQAAANGPDAPTVLAPMDAQTHQAFARAEEARTQTVRAETLRADSVAQAPAASAQPMRATGTWLFTDTDFASMAASKPASTTEATQRARTELIRPAPPVDTGSTSRLAKIDAADLDLDLSALDGGSRESKEIDLDVGAAPDDATQTARGPAVAEADVGESGLPDLEPVTLSEVGTKLDLARAYMDMGDPEGARSILSEVLSEGSLSQKQEARRLMDALPG